MKFVGRKSKGSSIVETTVGLIVVIPVVLFLIDVAAMVIAQTENDKLAKACARAAAELPDVPGENAAAAQVINKQQRSSLLSIPPPGVVVSNPQAGLVMCKTTIICTLPVPVPLVGPSSVTFNAQDVEPIVGELPQ